MADFKNEKEFTRWLLGEATSRGWKAAHLETHTIVRRPGGTFVVPSKYATGFPDIVAVHPQHGGFFAELKMPRDRVGKRKVTPEQLSWILALHAAGQRVHVWYPDDQNEILDVLVGVRTSSRLFSVVEGGRHER